MSKNKNGELDQYGAERSGRLNQKKRATEGVIPIEVNKQECY